MKSRTEIIKKIAELKPELELAEDAYFSAIEEKQNGGEIYPFDFLKIQSEYELIKTKVESLQWVVYGDGETNKKRVSSSVSHQKG